MKSISFFFHTLKIIPLFLLGGCSAVQVVNSVSKIYPAEIRKDIPFGEHAKLKYDLYLPNQASRDFSSTPVIVFFYGGSWNRGDKSEYEFVGRRLASLGYITAVPNYRLYPEVRYPDFLEDGAQSISHLTNELSRPEYSALKPARQFILMGHSAGAYNAAMLALDNRWLQQKGLSVEQHIKGLIGMAGAYNIYPIGDTDVQPVFHHPNYPATSQPIEFAKQPRLPSSLLLTPETDTIVSIERNSHALHQALQSGGNPSLLHSVSGTDHVTLIGTLSPLLFFKGSTADPIKAFIQTLYKKPGTSPSASQQG